MYIRSLFRLLLSLTLFCGVLGVSCAAPMSQNLNRVAKAACGVLDELASETDSPYIEMAERFLRSGDLHSARDQLLRYLTMVKFDEDVLALIQLIESQIPPELPKMLDPPQSPQGSTAPIEDVFGLPVDIGEPPASEYKAPILD
jgi:hypothetical protein